MRPPNSSAERARSAHQKGSNKPAARSLNATFLEIATPSTATDVRSNHATIRIEFSGGTGEKVSLILVGRRGIRSGRTLEMTPDAVEPAATSILGLRDVMKRLALSCAKRHAAGTLGTLRVIYNRYRSLNEQVPAEEIVFPLERSSAPPVASPRERRFHRYLPAADLYAQLVAEHLFIDLYRLAAESFAGEQASRLIAMDGATRNTERMQTQLLELEQRERQDEITRDILELISARTSLE